MEKRFVFVTLLIAMVVLTLMPVSLVHANDIRLPPVSGSDCDPTTFVYSGHTIAEGFAVSISADLPIDDHITQIKFGCAVAGLGESWWLTSPYYSAEYTPYVKEMWIRVEGDSHYTDVEDAIFDNTGTGESSCGLFEAVLTGIGLVFNAWQIYDWLAKIYQEPPVAEWDVNGHWSRAIIRQKTEPAWNPPGGRWVDPDGPLLQTGSANVWGYFEEGSSYVLNVTAQAEIYLQIWDSNNYVDHEHIGTYRVSFEVSLTRTLSISTSSGGTTDPAPGTYTYWYGTIVTVTAIPDPDCCLKYWVLDGEPYPIYLITFGMDSDRSLTAYFNHPPNIPSTPSGPTSGRTDISYTYSTNTTDPDGDNVYYQFYWSDGSITTTGWYASGATVSASHHWDSPGTYHIKVRAGDSYTQTLWSSLLYVNIIINDEGGGCPTLFVWDGTDYAEEGILNIHAESDITVQHQIQNALALENGVYNLQLRELDNYTSHIDQVKLYAVDYQGKLNLCPLTYAYHNELGSVKQTLLLDDGNRVDLKPTETIDMKFSPSVPYSKIAYFIFEINGYNMKWPGYYP